MTQQKRLYKSRTERMIDGVCGGIAKYFDLDPTLVRIAWVLLTLLGGSGIILYLAAMIIMPKEPYVGPGSPSPSGGESPSQSAPQQASGSSSRNSFFWGVLLILVGLFLFLENMGWSFWRSLWWFDAGQVLAILLILAGIAFMWGGRNSMQQATEQSEAAAPQGVPLPETGTSRRLHRSASDRKIFGVCGGLAEYFGIDSTIVRLLVVVAAVASLGTVLVAYVLLAIVLPRQQTALQVS